MRHSILWIIFTLLFVQSQLALAGKTPIHSAGGVYVIMPDQLKAIFENGSIVVPGETEGQMWKLSPAQANHHFGLQLNASLTSDQSSSASTWSSIHKIIMDEPDAKIIVVLDDDYTPYVDPTEKSSKRGYVGIAFILCDGSDSRKLPGRAFLKLKLSQEEQEAQPEATIPDAPSTPAPSDALTSKSKDEGKVKKEKEKEKEKEKDAKKDKDSAPSSDKTDDKGKKVKASSSSHASSSTPPKNAALANSLLTGGADKKSVLGALRGRK